MSESDDKSVVVFVSDAFDMTWPQDGEDPNVPPVGNDVMLVFRDRLAETGCSLQSGPFKDENGWWMGVSLGEKNYDVWVN